MLVVTEPDSDVDEGPPDFDAEAFFAQMEENRVREAAIAAERPTAEIMGTILDYAAKVLHAHLNLRRMEGLIALNDEEAKEFDFHPTAGSPADADLRWGASLTAFEDNPVRITLDLIQRLAASTADHLEGLAHLTSATTLIRAPISLARSALEAAATAAHLVDLDVTRDDRLRRALNLRLAELGEARYEHADDDGDDDEVAWYEQEISAITAGASSVNMKVKNADRRSRGLPSIHPKDSTQTMIQAILEKDLGSTAWRSMSAVAHSREAMMLIIIDALDPRSGDEQWRARDLATNCMPALMAVNQLMPRLGAYLGWDMNDAWDDEDNVLLNVWHAGSGGHDEAIKRKLFGDEA